MAPAPSHCCQGICLAAERLRGSSPRTDVPNVYVLLRERLRGSSSRTAPPKCICLTIGTVLVRIAVRAFLNFKSVVIGLSRLLLLSAAG